MMKAIAQSLKPALARRRKPYVVSVGLDIFGNAIPEAKSAQRESAGGVSRIVRRQDVLVYPSRKRSRTTPVGQKAGAVFKRLLAFTSALWARLRPWRKPAADRNKAISGSLLPVVRPRPMDKLPQAGPVAEPLECEFKPLPLELNARAPRLEPRIYEVNQEPLQPQVTENKLRAQLLPLALVVALVVVYLMYVMTGMQGSMTAMSGNIQTMANDTRAMSQNMQAMNQSMHDMNHNVAEMNQKVGTLAKTAAPMGEAASTVSPFTKMFKSLMPF
jgi:uncharacterized protein YoxC